MTSFRTETTKTGQVVNRLIGGVDAGKFTDKLDLEASLVRELRADPNRPATPAEAALADAREGLANERTKFNAQSTTLLADGYLTELEQRGDKIASITAVPGPEWAGNPGWRITEMITADGRNLVTSGRMDVNLAETRIIDLLEGAGDDITGSPEWIEKGEGSDGFSVNLGGIRESARHLGVGDGEDARSEQRRSVLLGVNDKRELASSEYTLAAAAVLSERITADYPGATRLRFRYEDSSFRVTSLADMNGVEVSGELPGSVSEDFNKHIHFSDVYARPIDADGNAAESWFQQPSRLPSSWEWDLSQAQELAAKYR